MTRYEIMYIVRPNLEESAIDTVNANFEKVLKENGATITGSKKMGQRELAYEIKKFKTGYYFVINVEANDDKAIKEFDRLALISEDVVRHLIINLDKE